MNDTDMFVVLQVGAAVYAAVVLVEIGYRVYLWRKGNADDQ